MCRVRPILRAPARSAARRHRTKWLQAQGGKGERDPSSLSYCRILPSVVTIAFQPALARARAALERGQHADAIGVLTQALKASGLKREDEVGLRSTLAEAWLMADDVTQAASVVGRPPDPPRDDLPPALLSTLWRIHGRIAFAKGDQSRAIALLGRALRQAELAHD